MPTRSARLVWVPYSALFLLSLSDLPRYAGDKQILWWQAMSTNMFDYPKAPGSGSNLSPLFTGFLISSAGYSLGAHLKLRQIARQRASAETDLVKEPQTGTT
ncbi:MAG: hypothetical protein H7Y20_01720 [Bryobacteraceae bacterium]|nr:hypothetical protein [Bryobacteraceae bacterium]